MEIDFLRHFNFAPSIISTLQNAYGAHMLPLQIRAIRQGKILEGNNLIICSPTSSGKTFLSEILFLYTASQNRNSILLVPTKALANQRYEELKQRYQPLGYEIALSTRDHPYDDKRILEGRFHLAIVIYEKMRMFLSLEESLMSSLGACVVDELHYLFDPQRGPELEALLTRIRREQNLQCIGLSATVSDPKVAEWLHAELLMEEERPVELRQGILCKDRFLYTEFNSGREGEESFPAMTETEDEGTLMLDAARHFAALGEPTLLFWPRRDLCYTAARKLAGYYEPDSSISLGGLESLEATSIREFLRILLPKRIAVHTSDLSHQERKWVEKAVANGEVLIICATGTLAEGINFPVINVLTTKRMYSIKPEDMKRGSPPTPQPLSRDRLFNMIGRAGRLGLSEFGRGMIVTTSEGDIEGLFNSYMRKGSITFQPRLFELKPSQVILKTMGYYRRFHPTSCKSFLESTLSGYCAPQAIFSGKSIEKTFQRLLRQGLLVQEPDGIYPTPMGDLVIKSGLSILSAQRLEQFLNDYLSEENHPLEILLEICLLNEMRDIYVYVPRQEIRRHHWSRAFLQLANEMHIASHSNIHVFLEKPQTLRDPHHHALKKVFVLFGWIQGEPIPKLEQKFGLYAGAILHLAEEAAWLIGCLYEMSSAHARNPRELQRIQILRERVLLGLPEPCIDWSPFMRRNIVTRSEVLQLWQFGFHSPQAIHEEDRKTIRSLLPEAAAASIFQTKKTSIPEKRLSVEYIIELTKSRPDRVLVNGQSLPLTKLQASLIACLAHRVGECVPYQDLLEEMWPESIGDRKQISRQKTEILKKIRGKIGKKANPPIETVPGVGLILHAEVVHGR